MLKSFLKKEFKLELRRKSVIAGLSLYLVSIVFIYYLAIGLNQQVLTPLVWSAVFWSTLLFSAINTIAKSFIGEKKGLEIYYYSIVNPQVFIISKMVYNSMLGLAMGLFGYGLFATLLTNPIQDFITFLLTLALASTGFACSLTLVSGLAAKANNSNVLMAVLSFPVVISILLIAIKATKNCIDGLDTASSYDELTTLFAINCLVGAVSYLLFPYIWRN
ncbi:MAG: heme exporter protein CcmB [Flammeovirgaceae bacterium]